jgi:hypothetical protein
MDLRDDQFEQVSLLVNRSVSMHSLRVELLDHLCCYIEAQLDLGISFEAALNEAILQLSPEGLTAVEERTVFLLTFKKQLTMKKLLYFSGFLTSLFTLTGFVFRTMKWTGGSQFWFLGNCFLLFSMIFIFIILKRNYAFISGIARVRSLSGAIGGFIAAIGSIFKFLHYPGANVLFIIGSAILIFVFLPILFIQLYKNDVAKASEPV